MTHHKALTRRSVLALIGGIAVLPIRPSWAAEDQITVHRDPNCGCCSGWVQHLRNAGFRANVIDTQDIDAVKKRLGVPDDLSACHTAEIAGYLVEGPVPATALKRFLSERPNAAGLAVRGMPIGSPGMEGANPEPYDVVLFGPNGRRAYMRFLGERTM